MMPGSGLNRPVLTPHRATYRPRWQETHFFSLPSAGEYFNSKSRLRRNTAFYDLYEVPNGQEGKESSVPRLVPGFGNDYHEGPASWCAATGELFVTLSNVIAPDQLNSFFPMEHVRLRLAIKKKADGAWKSTEELPFNNSTFHTAHPAISATGDTLVFASDMPGGKGKSDLWMSVRRNGTWSQPVNLGDMINTPGNEMYPAFGPGGLLMFASDGHAGSLGGLDIYYTSFPQQGEVKNAGAAINSAYDDFGLVVSSDAAMLVTLPRTGREQAAMTFIRLTSCNLRSSYAHGA
jgi:hypothetical protein